MDPPPDPTTPRYPVRLAAGRTGLSPHVLRAWERRYQVVAPGRSEGGQRLYSDLDIERLRLLRRLTDRGHAIGRIATLPLAELERLDQESSDAEAGDGRPVEPAQAESARAAVDEALQAARRFDAADLRAVLERAAVTQGIPAFLEEVVAPVVDRIGHGWADGSLTVAQEHMATAVIRGVLGWLLGVFETHGSARQAVVARRLVLATPPGQIHEIGALLAAVTAAAEGWTVTYLGPDLPPGDLVGAARRTVADAVGLSLVYDAGEAPLLAALREARAALPDRIPLIVGGAAASPLRGRAEAMGLMVVSSLAEFRTVLHRLAGG
jgi:DNA-binding transcriptional MerR regulator/methylmalonyl-CoA mutase cobalamin-binding subunit